MEDLLREAFNVISVINEEIFEQVRELDFYCNLEVKTNGSLGEIVICFGEYNLWDTMDDQRVYIDEGTKNEELEPLEPFVRKELNYLLDVFRKIKV